MTVFSRVQFVPSENFRECLKELKHNLQRRLRVVKFEFIQQWLKILADVRFFCHDRCKFILLRSKLKSTGVDFLTKLAVRWS